MLSIFTCMNNQWRPYDTKYMARLPMFHSNLRAPLEALAGECSYSYTLDQEWSSSIRGGCPLGRSSQLQEGCTQSREGGRGHPPSQPDQSNQPWWSTQPDHPHILIDIWKESVSYVLCDWNTLVAFYLNRAINEIILCNSSRKESEKERTRFEADWLYYELKVNILPKTLG